jgi:hypothetical protein
MRVKDIHSGLFVPMLWDRLLGHSNKGKVWVVGVNKSILHEYGFKVLNCIQMYWGVWRYEIDRMDFESFLVKNNLPILSYGMGY